LRRRNFRPRRIEQAIEDVLEFHADLEVGPLFDVEVPAEAHIPPLPLSSAIVVEGRGRRKLTGSGIDPGVRIEGEFHLVISPPVCHALGRRKCG
jgi:hypothetical protein